MHCYPALIYVDAFGLITRVEVNYSRRMHNTTLFQKNDVFLHMDRYFSEAEKIIVDAGFVWAADKNRLIALFKREPVCCSS